MVMTWISKKTNLMAIHGFFSWEKMQCWGLNSHYFHIIGDKLINLIGFYIPMIHVIKGGMSLSPIQGILRKTRKLIYGTSMPMFFRCEPFDGNQKSGDHLPVDMENFPLFYHGFKHHSRWLAWGISEPSTVCWFPGSASRCSITHLTSIF